MNKYYKIMIWFGILYLCGILIFAMVTSNKIGNATTNENTILTLNNIVKDAEKNWKTPEVFGQNDYGVEYCILNEIDEVLYNSGEGKQTERISGDDRLSVEQAIKNRYPYAYVIVGEKVVGCVIIFDDGSIVYRQFRWKMILGFGVGGILILFVFGMYIHKNVIVPFQRMEQFAGKVAEGKLDEPLLMDRSNLFGVFSESFDIMREELSESKKRELALQKKERELVASLSHDLKTPITGIKLTSELLEAMLTTPENVDKDVIVEKIDSIYKKADQIDVLVSDLFASTLDDLGEFKVNCQDEESKVVDDILARYDDKKLVNAAQIPNVILHVDAKRLSQVIGNIISNSYKYAGTKIDIDYEIEDSFLKMKIRDYGPGVPAGELELITNKFYRGKQWENSKEDGNGLGLYIAKTLMEKMGGAISLASKEEGLEATLLLPLS